MKALSPISQSIEEVGIQKVNQFMGSRVFVKPDSRTTLPVLKPMEPIPLWKILSKFVGKDLARISMPVILNEPLTML